MKIELTYKTIENLEIYSKILNKDINLMINEALSQYFENEEKRMLEKSIENDNIMTNLDYDEFWDGVDI
ncbi:hypothetical protein MNB_SV-9-1040 [hydrothermal vent metagenome]|uniref:CopG family transcriptional regulator n=1 Tax=hydrothermal vent metagenome TaxID=652676 RepID=A0A1W1BFQ9_9ZZZZ